MNRLWRHLRNNARRKLQIWMILIVCFLQLVIADDPARLVVRPDTSIVANDSKVSFFCRADGNPLPNVVWRINGKSITDASRISIKSLSTGLSTLRFEKVLMSDNASMISCSADNGVANPVVAEATMTVLPQDQLPSGFPQIDLHPSLKSVEQGKTAYVSCRVRGEPRAKVLWLRDLIPLDIRSDGRYSVSTIGNPGALMIQHAREEDQGKYECVARNSLGVAHSKAANLYVKVRRVPPYFSMKLEPKYMVGIGGNINLTCVAVGYPMPRVFWKKTDQQVLDDPSSAPIGKNVLKLTNVENTENFTCVAVSALGNIEATTKVVAKELPPPPKDVAIGDSTATSIVISWNPPITNEIINKYIVKYKLKSTMNQNQAYPYLFEEKENEESGEHEKHAESRSQRGKPIETTETSVLIDGLSPFQTYEFTVRSVGPVGPGDESLPVEAQTLSSAPSSEPTGAQARSLGRDSILVKWRPCEHPNGLINKYVVHYSIDNEKPMDQWLMKEVKADELMTTIYGLEPLTRYFVKIIAGNDVGNSPPSSLVTVSTRQGIPGQPVDMEAKPLDSRRIQLTWQKPLFSSPIHGYTIRFNASDGEKELTLTSPMEKHVVTGLQPDKIYSFRIAAYSQRGQGEFSEPLTSKTIASIPLEPPELVDVVPLSSRSLRVQWKAPNEKKMNGVLNGYRVTYRRIIDKTRIVQDSEYDEDEEESGLQASDDSDEYSVVFVSKKHSSYIIKGLQPYTKYEVMVAAATDDGYGPDCDARVVKTLEDEGVQLTCDLKKPLFQK